MVRFEPEPSTVGQLIAAAAAGIPGRPVEERTALTGPTVGNLAEELVAERIAQEPLVVGIRVAEEPGRTVQEPLVAAGTRVAVVVEVVEGVDTELEADKVPVEEEMADIVDIGVVEVVAEEAGRRPALVGTVGAAAAAAGKTAGSCPPPAAADKIGAETGVRRKPVEGESAREPEGTTAFVVGRKKPARWVRAIQVSEGKNKDEIS